MYFHDINHGIGARMYKSRRAIQAGTGEDARRSTNFLAWVLISSLGA